MTNDKYNIDNILDALERQANDYLLENNFYTTFDERVLESNIDDIMGGDNFAEYCEEFFEMLEKEDYYD